MNQKKILLKEKNEWFCDGPFIRSDNEVTLYWVSCTGLDGPNSRFGKTVKNLVFSENMLPNNTNLLFLTP